MAGPWSTIVDASTLARHVHDSNLVLLDVRYALKDLGYGAAQYAAGHLPGARFVDMERDLTGPRTPATGRHPVPDPDAFRDTVSGWGVADGVQVVAYDDAGALWASRAWWLLRDYGHEDVACLDGGVAAWRAAGGALSTDEPRARAPTRFAGRPGHMPTATTWDLTTRTPRRILDARAPERYRGESEPVDPVAGHIPGAVNAPTAGNLAPDGRFLPSDALRARFSPLLADLPAREAAVYCGSGITATHDILAMEVAGLGTAKLYPGSWSEWIRNPLRPVARGEGP